MIGFSTVNSKGQVTIPQSIRKNLGIKPGMRVMLSQKNRKVSISHFNEDDFWALRGSVKPIDVDFKTMRKSFEVYLGTPKHLR